MLGQLPGIGRPIDEMPDEFREWIIDFGDSVFAPKSDCPRCRFLVTQRGAVSFVTGRGMAVHDGGSVNRRHLGQSDVGANS